MKEHGHVLLSHLATHEHASRLLNEGGISRAGEAPDGGKLVLRSRRVCIDGLADLVLLLTAVLDRLADNYRCEVCERGSIVARE